MAKYKVTGKQFSNLTRAQQDAAITKSIRDQKIKGPHLYPESEVASMSAEEKADLQALNAKEALETARGGTKLPKGMAKAIPGEISKVTEKLEKLKEVENENLGENTKASKELSKRMIELAKAIVPPKGKAIGGVIGGAIAGVKDFFTLRGFFDKTGFAKRGSGGLYDTWAGKREAQAERIDQARKMDPKRYGKISNRTMRSRDDEVQKAGSILEKAHAEKDKYVTGKPGGWSEETWKASPHGAEIERTIEKQTIKMHRLDPSLKAASREKNKAENGAAPSRAQTAEHSTRAASMSSAAGEEATIDQNKMIAEQTELLKEIRDNTGGKKTSEKKEGTGNKFGDGIAAIGKGIAAAMKTLGAGFKVLGAGIGKGFQLAGQGIGKGMAGLLGGLGKGIAALGEACRVLVDPIVIAGLAIFTATIIGIAAALRIAAPAITAFVPVLLKVADVIGNVFLKALEMIPDTLRAIGDVISDIGGVIVKVITAISDGIGSVITTIADGMEKLSKLDAGNLFKVGAAMVPIAAGIGLVATASAGAAVVAASGKAIDSTVDYVSDIFQTKPKAPKPQAAERLTNRLEENAAGANGGGKSEAATTVVSAPTTNNRTSVVQMKRPERSTERSSNMLLASVYS